MTDLLTIRDKLLRYPGIMPMIESDVPDKSVLVIEPTNWHGEVIPPVVNYFLKMGFHVDVVVSDKNYTNDLLKNVLLNEHRVRIFHLFLPAALSDELFRCNMRRYKYIFLTSTDDFTGVYYPKLFKDNFCSKFTKNNIFFIEHQWELFKTLTVPKERKGFLSHAVALHKFPYSKNISVPYISPTLYSNTKISKKNKQTHFLVAGRFDAKCRDMSLLLRILEKLNKSGVADFHLNIVGRVGQEELSPEFVKYSNNVSIWGDVTNAQLYEIVKKSDFILALLSEKNKQHISDYTTNKTSGSFGLSVGFVKPVIVNEFFAAKHGFSEENAVLYKNDELENAVISAIKLSRRNYKRICKGLLKKKQKQEEESLINLRTLINI